MQESEQIMQFMASNKKARALIHEDAKNTERIKLNSEDGGWGNEYGGSYVPKEYPQVSATTSNKYTKINMSKLPKEIVESMVGSPIQQEVSVLDNIYDFNNIIEHKKDTISEIKEDKSIQPIDYSIIRMICEDTMKKYVGHLKKAILTETKNNSTSSLKAMKSGDKFSFINDQGDIFEAKLEYKGNINKK